MPTAGYNSETNLLEVELLDTGLIRSDGSALDTDLVLDDSLRSVDGDLVVGLITVLKALISH